MTPRIFDIVVSIVGLVVFSPLMLVVAGCIKAYDHGPVIYRAERVGQNGRIFKLYKFRTMIPDADRKGPGITAGGDARITPVGRVLRKTKLDELPQLLNVIKGDMSIVGPRPEDPRYVEQYTPEQRRVLAVRPGITSAASVRYRREEEVLSGEDWERAYIEEVLPEKLALDLEYLDRRSLWSDIGIVFRTLVALFR